MLKKFKMMDFTLSSCQSAACPEVMATRQPLLALVESRQSPALSFRSLWAAQPSPIRPRRGRSSVESWLLARNPYYWGFFISPGHCDHASSLPLDTVVMHAASPGQCDHVSRLPQTVLSCVQPSLDTAVKSQLLMAMKTQDLPVFRREQLRKQGQNTQLSLLAGFNSN